MNTTLPIDGHLHEVDDALSRTGGAVILAPPGSGKTTRVAPHLLQSGLGGDGTIVIMEPRRVAVRAAARHMARQNGWSLGDRVGYQIRMERVASRQTRILVVTEGILLRMLEDDPFLQGVSCVLVDEFHERSIHADLALAMLAHVRRQVRPELGIVVMSATLDPGPVSDFLGGCPVIRARGKAHPVQVRHAPVQTGAPLARRVLTSVRDVLESTDGHVLVFLPGVGEIRRAARTLEGLGGGRDLDVLTLYGDMDGAAQDAVLEPGRRRKVILATNVAETSVTIAGVSAVVDTGLARIVRFDPAVGLDRLELGRISRASAAQRAGRAGRTGPGVCVRLYPEAEYELMAEAEVPEILRTDITGPVLSLLAWGEDPRRFPWYQRPGGESLDRAMRLLELLGAVQEGKLTRKGRAMASLPVHPRMARLMVEGHALGCPEQASRLAAFLSERDPVRRPAVDADVAPPPPSRSDLLDRLELHERDHRVNRPALRLARRTGRKLERDLFHRLGPAPTVSGETEDSLLSAVASAYPDRLARRREPGSAQAVMVGGRGVRLTPESAVRDSELFVCVDLAPGRRGKGAGVLVRQASAVTMDWLEPRLVSRQNVVVFDEEQECVLGREQTLFLDLLLREKPDPSPDPQEVAHVLAHRASRDVLTTLALDREPVRSFLARVRFLGRHMPELDLPDLDEERIRAMLPRICMGRSSLEQIRGASLLPLLEQELSRAQRQGLARHAPVRMEVASGRSVTLEYDGTGPPVLAVRIQEMFGTVETPRVANGRVAVMLHLLAPSMRPQQMTRDLLSFWENTYSQVRRELRARYPKHAWPEDPLSASPQGRPGVRRGRRKEKRR